MAPHRRIIRVCSFLGSYHRLLWGLNEQYVAIALTSVVAWFSLAFVVFDRYIHHSGPSQQNDENGARAYYPNVQTWSYGLLMGAGL